jgi:DNA-binding NarL/FixJ family response regulator
MHKITVYLADDHPIFLDGLMAILSQNEKIQIVGHGTNGLHVKQYFLEGNTADVVVLDIRMPYLDGVEVTKFLKGKYPNIRILILSMHNDYNYIRQLREEGVSGYILKDKGREELETAIFRVMEGKEYFSKDVLDKVLENLSRKSTESVVITTKEKSVLTMIGDGHTTPEISVALKIKPSTVETHRRNLMSKIGLRNTLEMVRYAVENGFVTKR